jgi:cob(I)alamin adenosyltransferase
MRAMTTRIYTKTGDTGETSLYGGTRVHKDHVRVEAYGTVDELNAGLGQVRALAVPPELGPLIAELQALLFELGAELATPPARRRRPTGLGDTDVAMLEGAIDTHEAALPALKSFILPTGTPVSAALHVARAVCRRAERHVVTLRQLEPETSAISVIFLNRLGDLLFVLARRANQLAGVPDSPWHPRQPKTP